MIPHISFSNYFLIIVSLPVNIEITLLDQLIVPIPQMWIVSLFKDDKDNKWALGIVCKQ